MHPFLINKPKRLKSWTNHKGLGGILPGISEQEIHLHYNTLRAPMSAKRLAKETGFAARFGLEEAFADYMKWLEGHDNLPLPSGIGQAQPS